MWCRKKELFSMYFYSSATVQKYLKKSFLVTDDCKLFQVNFVITLYSSIYYCNSTPETYSRSDSPHFRENTIFLKNRPRRPPTRPFIRKHPPVRHSALQFGLRSCNPIEFLNNEWRFHFHLFFWGKISWSGAKTPSADRHLPLYTVLDRSTQRFCNEQDASHSSWAESSGVRIPAGARCAPLRQKVQTGSVGLLTLLFKGSGFFLGRMADRTKFTIHLHLI